MKRFLVSILLVGSCLLPALGQEKGQRTFSTPDEAAKALREAVAAKDQTALIKLVGSQSKAILSTGDAKEDASQRQQFLQAWTEEFHLVPIDDSLTMLVIGHQKFPVPLPLVKKGKAWYFDGLLGLEEILARRIGENELNAIRACKAYVQAQREYAILDPDGNGIAQYAQHISSSEGTHDGLFWEPEDGELASPLGPLMADAGRSAADSGKPFHGYYYRILTQQGPSAPGGAFSYIINGHMVGGFALVAYPAKYGETGIMTFLVGPSGLILEKDLKDQTGEFGASVKSFDPGEGWKRI